MSNLLSDDAREFLSQDPELICESYGYSLYHHPVMGDIFPIHAITPNGEVTDTGFYNLEDVLVEIASNEV